MARIDQLLLHFRIITSSIQRSSHFSQLLLPLLQEDNCLEQLFQRGRFLLHEKDRWGKEGKDNLPRYFKDLQLTHFYFLLRDLTC